MFFEPTQLESWKSWLDFKFKANNWKSDKQHFKKQGRVDNSIVFLWSCGPYNLACSRLSVVGEGQNKMGEKEKQL